jgi:uncharacterized protein YndB with AHSA1/START domain
MNVQETVEIKTTAVHLFALLNDDEKAKQWIEGLIATTYTTPKDPENALGCTFRQQVREMGRTVEYEGLITAFEPPHRLAIRLHHHRFTLDAEYVLEEFNSHTRLTYRAMLIKGDAMVDKLSQMFGWYFRRQAGIQLKKLKEIAERA